MVVSKAFLLLEIQVRASNQPRTRELSVEYGGKELLGIVGSISKKMRW